MSKVEVFATIRGKLTPAREVEDVRVRAGLLDMALGLERTLAPITCTVHKRGARDVRVTLNAKGVADLRYDACCAELQRAITAATT
jgi:hypothetical protein